MEYEFYTKPDCYKFKCLFTEGIFSKETEQRIKEIRRAAAGIHASVNQFYDGSIPYIFHLDMVADQFIYIHKLVSEQEDDMDMISPNDFIALLFAAYFHDTIEDCRLHYYDVLEYAKKLLPSKREKWTEFATDIVFALTEEKGKTRAARHNDKYYAGIACTPFAFCIKTADMLANAIYSWYTNEKRYIMYRDEFKKCAIKMADEHYEYCHKFWSEVGGVCGYFESIPSLYPTKNKQELLLSKEDMDEISKIACDFSSGNHLLRPRTEEYLKHYDETMKIISKPENEQTKKDKQIIELFNAVSESDIYALFCGRHGIKNETLDKKWTV